MMIESTKIKNLAPAIFSKTKSSTTSNQYDFVNSSDIIDVFKENDWFPNRVSQVKNYGKKLYNRPYGKHLISFRNPTLPTVKGLHPEINVLNAHDGSTKFKMFAGLYRMVCVNSLIVSDSEFESFNIRHRFLNPEVISNGIKEIVDIVPQIIGRADDMIKTKMSDVDAMNLSQNVINKIWEDPKIRPFESIQLLASRRHEDNENNLWTTYNKIQENLMKGGLIGTTSSNKKRKMKGITNIDKTVKVNQILWNEATDFLKAA